MAASGALVNEWIDMKYRACFF